MKCVRETSKGQKRKDKMLHIFFLVQKYLCMYVYVHVHKGIHVCIWLKGDYLELAKISKRGRWLDGEIW